MEEDVETAPLNNVVAPLDGGSGVNSGGVGFGGGYGMGHGYGIGYGRLSYSGGYGDIGGIWRLHRPASCALTSPVRHPTFLSPSTSVPPHSFRHPSSCYGGSGGSVGGCYGMGQPG